MKVLGINGSPRNEGNTAFLMKTVGEALKSEGIDFEVINLGTKAINGCIGCGKCHEDPERLCAFKNDAVNDIFKKMKDADGVLLGSPVYFSDLTTNLKAVIERVGVLSMVNGNILARKPGAAVVAVRRSGAVHTFDSINHFFLISEMIIVGSTYWNVSVGRDPGDCEKDTEGIKTMTNLGKNMSWLIKKLA